MFKRILTSLLTVFLLVCVLAQLISCGNSQDKINEQSYKEACALLQEKKYEEAYAAFSKIKDYSPAKKKLKNFFFAPQTITYSTTNSFGQNWNEEDFYQYSDDGNILKHLQNNQEFLFSYNEAGDVLSGHELPNYTPAQTTYFYDDGKLNKISINDRSHNIYYSFSYNENAEVSKIILSYAESPSSYTYSFTYSYDRNNSVKTVSFTDVDDCNYTLYYDKNGAITQIQGSFEDDALTITMTYNSYGLEKVSGVFSFDPASPFEFCYSYDINGKLLEMTEKDNGEIIGCYSFSNHKLCYSENEQTHQRISVITRTSPLFFISSVS